jgi:hypothetical protein
MEKEIQIKNKMISKIKKQNVDTLKIMVEKLWDDNSDEASLVFPLVLAELRSKMIEKDFIVFCDQF